MPDSSIRVVKPIVEAFLCVKEVAEITGYSEWWVREHAEELGARQGYKGCRLRFTRLGVLAYFERRKTEAPSASVRTDSHRMG